MKIKMTTTVTEIEADARELRESQTITIGQNLTQMLSRIFQNHEPFDEEEDPEGTE